MSYTPMAIGAPVIGATLDQVLYTDSNNYLAQSSYLSFNPSIGQLTVGNVATNYTNMGTNSSGNLYIAPSGGNTLLNGTLGIGFSNSGSPARQLEVVSSGGNQLRLSFSPGASFTDLSTNSNGNLVITPSAGLVGIGINPTTRLHIGGNVSAASWTTMGIALLSDAAIYTDNSSTGTVAAMTVNRIGIPTIAANSSTTYTAAGNFVIDGAPTASTNVTITQGYSLWVKAGNVRFDGLMGIGITGAPVRPLEIVSLANQFRLSYTAGSVYCDFSVNSAGQLVFSPTGSATGFGSNNPTGKVTVGGNATLAAWGPSGPSLQIAFATATDNSTADGATVATAHFNTINTPTLAATNAVSSGITYTSSATLYVANQPTPGTLVTITKPYAILVNSGNSGFAGFNSFHTGTYPAAFIHLGGSVSTPAWTSNGVGIRFDNTTFTDSSSATGTVSSNWINHIGTMTIAATNASVVYTTAATLNINGAPAAGTNVSITNPLALRIGGGAIGTAGNINIGSASLADAKVNITSSYTTTSAIGVNGKVFCIATSLTITDNITTSGTISKGAMNSIAASTFAAASGSFTITDAATLYIGGVPAAGTGVTITNAHAIYVAAGNITALGTSGNTHNWVNTITAPSKTATPVFTSYYGGNTNALGDPNAWALVQVNGTNYKIPLYS